MLAVARERSLLQGKHKLLQPVPDAIFWGDSRLCDVVVSKLGRVGRHKQFREFGDPQLAAVVFEGDANAPLVFAAEIP